MIIKKPLAKPQPKVTLAHPLGNTTDDEPKAVRSITIRMPPTTLGMLDNAVAMYDSDRTDVMKRAVRLLAHCLSGHNSAIVITDRAGKTKEINMVIDGVPT